MMEEGNNAYIQQRGQAIETIEQTINELGSIFGQLASMVSEQGNMIERIDANTEDVVDNVQGAQRELMKYWSRVSFQTFVQCGHSAMSHQCSQYACFTRVLYTDMKTGFGKPVASSENVWSVNDFLPLVGVDIGIGVH